MLRLLKDLDNYNVGNSITHHSKHIKVYPCPLNIFFLLQKLSNGFYNFAFKFYLASRNAYNLHLVVISQHTQESDQKITFSIMKFYEYSNLAMNGVNIYYVL